MLKNEVVNHILELAKERISNGNIETIVDPNYNQTGQYVYDKKVIHRPNSSSNYDIQDENYDYTLKNDVGTVTSLSKVQRIIDNNEIESYYNKQERNGE